MIWRKRQRRKENGLLSSESLETYIREALRESKNVAVVGFPAITILNRMALPIPSSRAINSLVDFYRL
jgi:hypothetical protein